MMRGAVRYGLRRVLYELCFDQVLRLGLEKVWPSALVTVETQAVGMGKALCTEAQKSLQVP